MDNNTRTLNIVFSNGGLTSSGFALSFLAVIVIAIINGKPIQLAKNADNNASLTANKKLESNNQAPSKPAITPTNILARLATAIERITLLVTARTLLVGMLSIS